MSLFIRDQFAPLPTDDELPAGNPFGMGKYMPVIIEVAEEVEIDSPRKTLLNTNDVGQTAIEVLHRERVGSGSYAGPEDLDMLPLRRSGLQAYDRILDINNSSVLPELAPPPPSLENLLKSQEFDLSPPELLRGRYALMKPEDYDLSPPELVRGRYAPMKASDFEEVPKRGCLKNVARVLYRLSSMLTKTLYQLQK